MLASRPRLAVLVGLLFVAGCSVRPSPATGPAGARSARLLDGEGVVAREARGATAQEARDATATAPMPATRPVALAPSELVEIAKVVDGDTLHVRRKGGIDKLRLLSVDTEERIRADAPPGAAGSASSSKPGTVFGEECALWARQFFAGLAPRGEAARIGLVFPGGDEKKDVYGRLLCHVILPDGRDYNRMLVELGKSPYFNKYGNSDLDHAGFVAAQAAARERALGIWDPRTNEPATAGVPAAKRPYPALIAWWDARARAIDAFRARLAAAPDAVVDADDPAALARAAASGREVEAFGELDRVFDEERGDRTLLLRASSKERALRVRIPRAARERFAALELDGLRREFRQNYLTVRGRIERGERGFELRCEDPALLRRAGPEPATRADRGR